MTAYSCICWLFHRIYYDARNNKHEIQFKCSYTDTFRLVAARLCVGQLYDKRRRHQPLFIVPTCLKDGTFAPVQCHPQTGYCWCVTPAGKPIPNSSLRHARPNCTRRGEDQLWIESTKESLQVVGALVRILPYT